MKWFFIECGRIFKSSITRLHRSMSASRRHSFNFQHIHSINTMSESVFVTAGFPMVLLISFEIMFLLWYKQIINKLWEWINFMILWCYLQSWYRSWSNMFSFEILARQMIHNSFELKILSNVFESWMLTSGLILHKVTLIFMWSPSIVTIMAHYAVKDRPVFSNYFQLETDCVVAHGFSITCDNPACRG